MSSRNQAKLHLYSILDQFTWQNTIKHSEESIETLFIVSKGSASLICHGHISLHPSFFTLELSKSKINTTPSKSFLFDSTKVSSNTCLVNYSKAIESYLSSNATLFSSKVKSRLREEGIKLSLSLDKSIYLTIFFMKKYTSDLNKLLKSFTSLLKCSSNTSSVDLTKLSMKELLHLFFSLDVENNNEEYTYAKKIKAFYFKKFKYELYLPIREEKKKKKKGITKKDIEFIKPIAKLMTTQNKKEKEDLQFHCCCRIVSPKTRRGKYKYIDEFSGKVLEYREYEKRMMKYIREKKSYREEREKEKEGNVELREKIKKEIEQLKKKYEKEYIGENYDDFFNELVVVEREEEADKENVKPIENAKMVNRRKSVCLEVLKEKENDRRKSLIVKRDNSVDMHTMRKIRERRRRSVLLDDDIFGNRVNTA